MMAVQFEAMPQIDFVRGMPVITRVEMDGFALESLGLHLQPPQQSASPAPALLAWQGGQVIEVKDPAPSHCIHEPETGGRDDNVL